jgi:mono/diheme cytochrome c family protein
MRPDASPDPGVETLEELADVGAFIILTPTPQERIKPRNQFLGSQRCRPFGALPYLVHETTNRLLFGIRIERILLGLTTNLAPGRPPVRGKAGSGFAFSWWVAPNLTPDRETRIGEWTDDVLARAIREGVAHDGHLLNPTIMPYESYRSMSDEDLASIIVYLRSIPPIRNVLPPMRTSENVVAPYAIPIYAPVPQPDVSTPVKRGAYLVQLGACQWCHTLRDQNRVPLPGLEFAGGDLVVNSFSQASCANLTPDPSGISYYDLAQFLRTMHTAKVGARKISPTMPWWFFGQMKDDDLKSIFAFLRTVKPVNHRVDNTEPVAYCRICKRKHHGGALN